MTGTRPRGYDPNAFERPSVTVDLVLLGVRGGRPAALLLKRGQAPFAGRWALPGGFVGIAESLEAAAERVLHEKAGIAEAHLEQLYTFGAVKRDPRMWIITVVYLALLNEAAFTAALAANPALLPATLAGGEPLLSPDGKPLSLAFDHAAILSLAVQRLRGKLDHTGVGFALLPPRFTLRQLQAVHEAVLGRPLNKPAFRRRMLDRGWLLPTGEREAEASHRPAALFRFEAPKGQMP